MRDPTGVEQELLELANRFRLDPAGEFGRLVRDPATREAHDADVTAALRFFGVDMARLEAELAALAPAPPLAWSGRLARAATAHARDLIAADAQAHRLPGGPDLRERIETTGYAPRAWAENVYAYAESAVFAHAGLVVDWGPGTPDGMQTDRGHRLALISALYDEAGFAARAERDPATAVGPHVVVQNLADDFDPGPRLVGVVHRDRDRDGAYDAGEGREGAILRIRGEGRDVSGPAGDWTLAVSEGEHVAVLSGAGVAGRIVARIHVGPRNEKLDLVDGRHLFTTADLDLVRGAAGVSALGVEGVALSGAPGRQRLEGASGADTLSGERGADRLLGRGGDDRLFGGPGRDALLGGPGDDRLDGGPGADRLAGGGGGDVLLGGGGADRLVGGAGHDRLSGGRGADTLRGGPGDDTLAGGPGADVFVFGPADGDDVVTDWRDGRDRLDLSATGLAFEDLSIGASGGDAVLRFAGGSVAVIGAAGLIDEADLLLA